jgi:predicted kinase
MPPSSRRWQRRPFAQLAAQPGRGPLRSSIWTCPCRHSASASDRRSEQATDASEADLEVLEKQLDDREPLAGDELAARRIVRSGDSDIVTALAPFAEHSRDP